MNESEHELRARLAPYFAFEAAFGGVNFIIPTLALHWQSCGLSVAQIMQLEAVFAVVLATCEVPSGYIADRVGRKPSLMIASVLVTSGLAAYAAGNSFADFILGECLLALAIAFISGANDAYIMDTLTELGKSHDYMRVRGRALATHMACSALAAVSGSWIAAEWGYRATFVPAVLCTCCLLPAALRLREPRRRSDRMESPGYLHHLWQIAWESLWNNRTLQWIILASATVQASIQAAFWMYQPYFVESGTPESWFGILYAGFNFFCAYVTSRAAVWLKRLSPGAGLLLFLVLSSSGYVLLALVQEPWSFSFLLLHQTVRGLSQPFFGYFMNREVLCDVRATVGSIASMACLLLYALAALAQGALAQRYGIPLSFGIMAACSLTGGIILLARAPVSCLSLTSVCASSRSQADPVLSGHEGG